MTADEYLTSPIVQSFDEWWANQVRAAMPRWIFGEPRNGTVGYVWWPLEPDEMEARLDHLASLKAHA